MTFSYLRAEEATRIPAQSPFQASEPANNNVPWIKRLFHIRSFSSLLSPEFTADHLVSFIFLRIDCTYNTSVEDDAFIIYFSTLFKQQPRGSAEPERLKHFVSCSNLANILSRGCSDSENKGGSEDGMVLI